MLTNANISSLNKYLFILLLFFLPLSVELEVFNSGSKILFLTEPLCALISLLSLLFIIKNRNQAQHFTKIDWVATAFILSIILSTLFSDSHKESFKFTTSLLWYFSAGYLVIRLHDFNGFQRKMAVSAFFIGSSILAAYVCLNYAQNGIFHETSYDLAKPFIEQGHTDLSVVIEPALFLGIIGFLRVPWSNKKLIGLLLFCTSLFIAIILYTISKASYVAIFFSLLALGAFLLTRNPKTLLKLSYFLIPIVIIFGIWKLNNYLHFQRVKDNPDSHYNTGGTKYDPNNPDTYKTTNVADEIFNQSTDTDKNDSNKERINRLVVGLFMYQLHPSFGIGMGTYPKKYLETVVSRPDLVEEATRTYDLMNSHNIYLSWLTEGGLITFISGLSIILLAMMWLVKDLIKGKSNYLKVLLFIFLISFVIHGFLHDFSQNARVIIPFWICIALVSRQMALNQKR